MRKIDYGTGHLFKIDYAALEQAKSMICAEDPFLCHFLRFVVLISRCIWALWESPLQSPHPADVVTSEVQLPKWEALRHELG